MKIQMVFPYAENVRMPFVFLDTISMLGGIKPLFETVEAQQMHSVTARLIHEKMTFGVDPFLLAQLDTFVLGTIDGLPLNIQ